MPKFSVPAHMPDWITSHVTLYLESEGKDGHMYELPTPSGTRPFPTLLLAATGKRTGQDRTVPLIYSKTAGGYVIIASRGGTPAHPDWYFNLDANPQVTIRVATEVFEATARTATGDEREALWQQMADLYPPYNDYQNRTERQIPVVVLDIAS